MVIQTISQWANLIWHDEEKTNSEQKPGCLYLGAQNAATTLSDLESTEPPITGIVNCTQNFPNFFFENDHIEYCRVGVNDENGANLLVYMEPATSFIQRHIDNNGSVLVHCQAGVSRSASIIIAYLIRYKGYKLDDALQLAKSKRKQVKPNIGFHDQLKIFEQRCHDVDFIGGITPIEVFDRQWAESSLARYQTVGHLLDDPAKECFPEINGEIIENADNILFVSLDYIFGRGISDSDIQWFASLCRKVRRDTEEKANNKNSSQREHQGTKPTDPIRIVGSLLTGQDSKFAELWSGEIYESDVKRVMDALRIR